MWFYMYFHSFYILGSSSKTNKSIDSFASLANVKHDFILYFLKREYRPPHTKWHWQVSQYGSQHLLTTSFKWLNMMCLVCVCLQEMSPGEVTLEGLLDMSEEQVCELLQKFGASEEECARLNASLSCLRKAHQLGETLPQTILE